MRIVPVYIWDSLLQNGNHRHRSIARLREALSPEAFRRGSFLLHEQQARLPTFLERILSSSRVIIIEGISGSGKDTFQKYLKNKLKDLVVHDYSEGELLWSWKHQQIKDIFKLQIRLMKNFLDYIAAALESDEDAVFLLNRFHLSTYTMYTTAITGQPMAQREYDAVINKLRTLPTHVFLLQLMEDEMEARSAHPERGIAWRRFQQHIFAREGFGNFVKRNAALQKAMVATATRQNIPFSILRLPSESSRAIALRGSSREKPARFTIQSWPAKPKSKVTEPSI